MVFIDDETYIPLEEIKKGMFKCYADIQEFLDVNESVINHEEFERIYMRSCVEAFEKDPNMVDYEELRPSTEKSMEAYRENKKGYNRSYLLYPFGNTFYLLPDGTLVFVTVRQDGQEGCLHIIRNEIHLLSTPYGDAIRERDYERVGKELSKAVLGLEDSIEIIPCMEH